jgi:DnaJ-class molecular chaperone
MEILKIEAYRDGGTIQITTDEGPYCIDNRLFTKTKGSIFYGYPLKDNSNIDRYQDEMKGVIIDALSKYKVKENNFNWTQRIIELLQVEDNICPQCHGHGIGSLPDSNCETCGGNGEI